MKILALDISKTRTGWAIWNRKSHHSSIVCGSFATVGDDFFESTDAYLRKVIPVIKEARPDFAVMEEGLTYIKAYQRPGSDLAGGFSQSGGNAHSLILHRLIGATQAVLYGLGIPHESVDDQTWRKAFLGFGRKKGFTTEDYKKAARAQCELEGIAVKNNDQSDAAGIAYWCGTSSQQFKLMMARAA